MKDGTSLSLDRFKFYLLNSSQTETAVEAMLIVVLPGKVIPAVCTFDDPRYLPIIRTASAALKDAENIEQWAKLSPEHKASSAVPSRYARFIVSVSADETEILPTVLTDWRLLAKFFTDATFLQESDEVWTHYQDRIREMKSTPSQDRRS
jgi:hypothetical protein